MMRMKNGRHLRGGGGSSDLTVYLYKSCKIEALTQMIDCCCRVAAFLHVILVKQTLPCSTGLLRHLCAQLPLNLEVLEECLDTHWVIHHGVFRHEKSSDLRQQRVYNVYTHDDSNKIDCPFQFLQFKFRAFFQFKSWWPL